MKLHLNFLLRREVATNWETCEYIDVSSKGKKPSCKLAEEVVASIEERGQIIGYALAKKKGKGKGKK